MTIVDESTHIANRIKSLTVPCGSRLMLIFFSSGSCFSLHLLGAGMACSETVGFPTGCSYFDRLGRPRLRNVKLFGFPPGCLCKRGFGSPRIWIPHPKTLADLDDPKRGFGSPADLDPSIYFVYDRLENDDVECWEPNPRTPKR